MEARRTQRRTPKHDGDRRDNRRRAPKTGRTSRRKNGPINSERTVLREHPISSLLVTEGLMDLEIANVATACSLNRTKGLRCSKPTTPAER